MKIKNLFRNTVYLTAAHDSFMAAISFLLSLFLRLGSDFEYAENFVVPGVVIFTAICTAIFIIFGLYKGVWRYSATQDLITITKAVTLSILLFLPAMFLFNRLEGMPRSMIVINWFVLIALLGGPRFFYRLNKDKNIKFIFRGASDSKRIPVILIGINQFSDAFLKEVERNRDSNYQVVAILDEDRNKIGRGIHHIPVMGRVRSLPRVLKKLKLKGSAPQKVIIAPDYLNGNAVSYVLKSAELYGLTVARLPRLTEFKDNIEKKIEMRPIVIEDLLGRPQTALDRNKMRELIEGKTILVTGAGGTIGGELTRQIATYKPKKLVLFEISEYNLYLIDKELEEKFPDLKRNAVISDVRDKKSVEQVFSKEKPDLVFHAAAIKHVPLAENNIDETVLTNVIGTQNVVDAANQFKAKGFVMISTDKAVHPSNIMGATKRLAEHYCQSINQENNDTKIVTVRFGNVLGSTGSVVPLFQRQLANGGPLTITHPEMTRYFMTVREAVELVIMASALGIRNSNRASGIYVLEMGTPVKIQDLAVQMIKLAGLQPEKDIKISYTGIRPGEKLHEELFYKEESPTNTECEGLLLATPMKVSSDMIKVLQKMMESASNKDTRKTKELLEKLVPEYKAAS